ncbi:NAD(P)-binding protein [Rhypophila sp. PSN 637]
MAQHNVLITGGSGYLGGTLLNRLTEPSLINTLPGLSKGNIYALVRNESQAEAVKSLYGANPLTFDINDSNAVRDAIVSNNITVVYFLVDPVRSDAQVNFIKALGEVRRTLTAQRDGVDAVHFLHTTGAKMFSSHTGAPTNRPLLDNDPGLFEIHRAQGGKHPVLNQAVQTNITVIEEGEKHGVRTYIFTPCIVYGKGEGFGNKISIQTVDIVKAAKAAGGVYKVDDGKPSWPVCQIQDNTSLYIDLLKGILQGGESSPDHGRNGFYLASSGNVVWDDLYEAMAKTLAKRGVIKDGTIVQADQSTLEKMGAALDGAPAEFVSVYVGGLCTFTAEHGEKLGWKPDFVPEHILEAADEEVDWILKHL